MTLSMPTGLKSVRLRYFNAAGADPSGEIGEDHEPETHLIPLILDAASGLRSTVQVFGTDYETPDGTAIRDYVHVSDLAHAHVLALQYLLDGGDTIAVNLASGKGTSVREVIDTACAVTGARIDACGSRRRPGIHRSWWRMLRVPANYSDGRQSVRTLPRSSPTLGTGTGLGSATASHRNHV